MVLTNRLESKGKTISQQRKRDSGIARVGALLFVLLVTIGCCLAQQGSAKDTPYLVVDTGGHTGLIRRVIFTHDDRYLISTGDDKTIRIWSLETGMAIRTLRGQIGEGDDGQIYAMSLSPDGKYLATGGFYTEGAPFFIRIFDFRTGKVVKEITRIGGSSLNALSYPNSVNTLEFSSDGRRLAEGNFSGEVRVWDWASGTSRLLGGHKGQVISVSFSPDGKHVVSGGNDGAVILWDSSGAGKKVLIDGLPAIKSVAFSPNGKYIAAGGYDRLIRLWKGSNGHFIKILAKHLTVPFALTFSRDGRRLLTGSSTETPETKKLRNLCDVLKVPSGKLVKSYEHDGDAIATAISRNMKLAAIAGGGDREIDVLGLEDGHLVKRLVGNGKELSRVGFAHDGRSIAFGSRLPGGAPDPPLNRVFELQSDFGYRPALSPNTINRENYFTEVHNYRGRELTTKIDPVLRLPKYLDVMKDGHLEFRITRRETKGYEHIAYTFTHDGQYIISGGDNGILEMFNASNGRFAGEFVGHANSINSIAVSPDDRTLVSGSSDQTLRLWDIQTGHNLLSVFVGRDSEWIAWTPQGYYTSSLNGDKYIGWHSNNGRTRAADFYAAEQFHKDFYRPDIIAEYLTFRDIDVAVSEANLKRRELPFRQGVLGAGDVSSFLPPVITVASPSENETTVESESLVVKATVSSTTLPIRLVRLFLNGSLVGSLETNSLTSNVSVGVRLQPGLNTLLILASNGFSESTPWTKTIYLNSNRKGARHDTKSKSGDWRITVRSDSRKLDESRPPIAEIEKANHSAKTNIPPSKNTSPQVLFVDPETDGQTVSDSQLDVVVAVTSTDSTLGKVTMLVNGEEQGSWTPGGFKAVARFTAALKPGRNPNEIKVIAADLASASGADTRTVFYDQQPISGKRDLIFLGIGVNKTNDPTLEPLSFAENDVRAVADVFESQQGEGRLFNKVITRVIPGKEEPESNRKAIVRGIEWLKTEARRQRNNIHIIYLAGHGAFDNDEDRNYYLFSTEHVNPPEETNDIRWTSIADGLNNVLSHGKGLLFLDTCHAGSSSRFTNLLSVVNKYGLKDAGIAFFLASDELGVSRERSDWEGGHGAFTAALIRGLRGEADKQPFGNNDGTVSIDELDRFISAKVPSDFDVRQKPKGFWIHGSSLEYLPISKVGVQ